MSHEHFLRAIIADPADDLPRLVYADWLEENGDPARAEFIRVQCELAGLPADDPRRPGLEDREHELLEAWEADWLGDWPAADAGRAGDVQGRGIRDWDFHRGFLRGVVADGLTLQEHGDRVVPRHPLVTTWGVTGPVVSAPGHWGEYAGLAWVRRIVTLDASRTGWPLGELGVWLNPEWWVSLTGVDVSNHTGLGQLAAALDGTPVAKRLRSLGFGGRSGVNFRWLDADNETLDTYALVRAMADAPLEHLAAFDCGLTGDGLRLLLSAPFAPHLKSLDISGNHIAPDAWRAFHSAARGMRLHRLNVSGTPLANTSLRPVLDARCVEPLEVLEVNRCGSARVNMEVVARSRFWTQAVEFHANRGTIPAATLEPLCAADGPPALRVLDLADNYVRTEGVKLICDAAWAGGLTCLTLTRNYLDDESLTVLAASGRFTKLRALHLAHNNLDQDRSDGEVITDTGVRRLAATPSLANLRLLTLGFTGVTDRSVDVLLNAPHWRLSGLGLDGCDLSPDAVRILASSPRLARLNWLDLAHNPRLSGDALLPLAESPYLSRLCRLDVGGVYVSGRTLAALRDRLGPRLGY